MRILYVRTVRWCDACSISIRMHVCKWIMYTGAPDAFPELNRGRGHAMTRTSGQSKGGGTARRAHSPRVPREAHARGTQKAHRPGRRSRPRKVSALQNGFLLQSFRAAAAAHPTTARGLSHLIYFASTAFLSANQFHARIYYYTCFGTCRSFNGTMQIHIAGQALTFRVPDWRSGPDWFR